MGGLMKTFALIALILMVPFTYKRHDLQVFTNHVLKHNSKHFEYNNSKSLKEYLNSKMPMEFYVFIHQIKRIVKKQFFKHNNLENPT